MLKSGRTSMLRVIIFSTVLSSKILLALFNSCIVCCFDVFCLNCLPMLLFYVAVEQLVAK